MISLLAISLVIIGTFIGTIGAINLKISSKHFGLSRKGLFNKNLLIAITAYGLSTIIFIPALKFGQLSVLYPFVSLGYIWVTIASRIILKEKITLYKWLGIIFIMIGVSFIGFGG